MLVLDEPTAGLDPAGRENLMANIRDYHRNKGSTIMLVSHSMDEIARNVDRILVLKSRPCADAGHARGRCSPGAEELLSAGLDVPAGDPDRYGAARAGAWPSTRLSTQWRTLERRAPVPLRKGGAAMLKDITLGQYFPGNTVAHKLDPRTKILLVMLYIIALFMRQEL